MGISSIFKKKHSKSSSQSSSNDGGRRSLDSAGARSSKNPPPRTSYNGGVVEVDHHFNPISSSHSPGKPASSAANDQGNRHPIVDFEPPQHSAPLPPPKDTTSAPTLPIPEFKAFSISSPSPSTNGSKLTPSVPSKGTSTLPPSTPFPLTIAHPPKTIPAPPTSFLVSDPPTISRGPVNPSYLSHTESIFSSVPYSPTAHLAYHTSLFPPTSPSSRALIKPSVVPHEQQRLDLAEKIKREHHPRKVGLDEKGEALFKKAGLEVKDREGKGTIDWTVKWMEPVVQEHVVVHEHRIYQTVVEREIHRYHVFPIIQPIVDNRPPSPSQELHYFRDSSNQWREIVGRDAAEEILRASGAQKSDETVSWVDDRAVRAERKELEDLVAGKEKKDRTGRLTEVISGKGLVSGEHKKMIGDEKEEDGRAKVVRGVAL